MKRKKLKEWKEKNQINVENDEKNGKMKFCPKFTKKWLCSQQTTWIVICNILVNILIEKKLK